MMNRKNDLNDEVIVKQAQSGDQEALDYLFEKYHNLAFYIALKICHCNADAEDIVQESFIEVNRSIKQLQEPKYFKAWLNRIIFSKSTKLFRGNKYVYVPEDEVLNTLEAQENRRYLLPEKELRFQSDADILRACIDALPEKMRQMVYLMYFEQMSIKEIAFACELPEGTVKSRLNHAKKQLKVSLEQYEKQNDHKLTFTGRGLEAMLVTAFAKEASTIVPVVTVSKPFSFSLKGHVIEPSMLMMASITTCATVGASAILYPTIKNQFFSEEQPQIVNNVMVSPETFTPTSFRNEMIETEKAAYQALTTFAHCEVELAKYTEAEQEEAVKLYEAMKQHGGAYYELLKNRAYFEEK